jgi:hypothetical protein
MNGERRARALLALALAAATSGGAITGCNALLDTGAYKVGTVEDGSTTDAVSVADAGDDGEEGSCGPSGLPMTSTTFQNVVAACVLAASCDPFLFQVTISQCISEDYLQSVPSPSDSCLSTISNCSDYAGCADNSIPTTTQCGSTNNTASCAGTTAINCNGADSNGSPFVVNCGALGLTCSTYADGDAGTVANCVVPGTCTDTDGNQHCDTNNNLYTCENGVKFGSSCNQLNATCKEDPVNGTSCYFNGTACTTPGYTCSTNNDTAEWCTSGNVLFKFNCSAGGLTCGLEGDGGSADCLAPGCSTDDYDNCSESCSSDGHTGYVCVGGAQLPIDCTNYGFTSCYDTMSTNGIYCQ